MGTEDELQTDRSRLRRARHKGSYDRESLYAIIDAQPVCHLGFIRDGAPVVIPTLAWREGDDLYWHGSSGSRALKAADGAEVCLTFTLVDGFVLARSGLHHSVNHRSAIVFGTARTISGTDEAGNDLTNQHLETMIDTLFPGRTKLIRPAHQREIKQTQVQWMPITEGSVKIRSGAPDDEEEDYDLPIWAGVLPVSMTTGTPIPDPRNLPGVDTPDGLDDFKIG